MPRLIRLCVGSITASKKWWCPLPSCVSQTRKRRASLMAAELCSLRACAIWKLLISIRILWCMGNSCVVYTCCWYVWFLYVVVRFGSCWSASAYCAVWVIHVPCLYVLLICGVHKCNMSQRVWLVCVICMWEVADEHPDGWVLLMWGYSYEHPNSHCNTLQHTATHCNTLQHSATYWQHTAPYCTTLHHTAPHCTTLHHAAPHCTTLHHAAPHCIPMNASSWCSGTHMKWVRLWLFGYSHEVHQREISAHTNHTHESHISIKHINHTLWCLGTRVKWMSHVTYRKNEPCARMHWSNEPCARMHWSNEPCARMHWSNESCHVQKEWAMCTYALQQWAMCT